MANTRRKPLTYKGTEAADDDDFLPCLRFVQACEMEGKTKLQFCIDEGIATQTLWQRQIKWNESGLLPKVRQIFQVVITDDARVAQSLAAQKYGEVLNTMLQLALHAKSEFVRLQAGIFVHDRILLPMMEARLDPGSAEQAYLMRITGSAKALDPLSIGQADDLEPEAPRAALPDAASG